MVWFVYEPWLDISGQRNEVTDMWKSINRDKGNIVEIGPENKESV
jgi:hypothetical protein